MSILKLKIIRNRLLVKVCWALLTNMLLWEMIIRFFIASPCTQEFDRELGYANIPNAKYIESTEGYVHTRFNSIGFNDLEPSFTASTRHILVVGDSYTEAFQVQKKDSYIQVAEELVQVKNPEYDLVKLGRDGLLPVQYSLIVEKNIDQLNPQIIILQFGSHSGSDLYASELITKYNNRGQVVSYTAEPRLEDEKKEQFRIIINNSALVYYLLKKFKPILMNIFMNKSGHNDDGEILSIKRQEYGHKSVHDMNKRFSYIFEKIKSHKTKVIVIYLPKPNSYFNSSNEQSNTLISLENACEEHDIAFVNFTKQFKDNFEKNQIPLNGFCNTRPGKGHLNKYGHEIVGKRLSMKMFPLL